MQTYYCSRVGCLETTVLINHYFTYCPRDSERWVTEKQKYEIEVKSAKENTKLSIEHCKKNDFGCYYCDTFVSRHEFKMGNNKCAHGILKTSGEWSLIIQAFLTQKLKKLNSDYNKHGKW